MLSKIIQDNFFVYFHFCSYLVDHFLSTLLILYFFPSVSRVKINFETKINWIAYFYWVFRPQRDKYFAWLFMLHLYALWGHYFPLRKFSKYNVPDLFISPWLFFFYNAMKIKSHILFSAFWSIHYAVLLKWYSMKL